MKSPEELEESGARGVNLAASCLEILKAAEDSKTNLTQTRLASLLASVVATIIPGALSSLGAELTQRLDDLHTMLEARLEEIAVAVGVGELDPDLEKDEPQAH